MRYACSPEKRGQYKRTKIIIISDSQVALKATALPQTQKRFKCNVRMVANRNILTGENKITLE